MENNVPSESVPSAAIEPTKKIGRVKGGYLIAAGSFKILNQNRSIMLFPLFALLIDLALVAAGIASYIYLSGAVDNSRLTNNGNSEMDTLYYTACFAIYLISIFIASFFQAGMVHVVNAHLNGQKMTFNEGFSAAAKLSGKIFFWSLIAATVGVILDMIANRFKLVGRLAAQIMGTAWEIVSFFIVPVLVLEKETVGGSIKRSGSVFKSKWGETLIANFSLSLFFMFIVMAVFCAMLAFFFLAQPPKIAMLAVFGMFLLFLVAAIIISSAIETIYRTTLYDYAVNNRISGSFNPELLIRAVKNE